MSLSSCFGQKKALSPSNDYEDCNPGWDIHIFSIPWNYDRYLSGEPLVYPNSPVWEVISF